MPISVGRSSSSGSHGQARASRVGTERSSFSAGAHAQFSPLASPRVTGRTSTPDEEKQFKEAAHHVLRLTEEQIEELLKNGDFVEVGYEQEISK